MDSFDMIPQHTYTTPNLLPDCLVRLDELPLAITLEGLHYHANRVESSGQCE